MNLGEWLPVTAPSAPACQNNHHHYPGFVRTGHDPEQYDFGWITVRWLSKLGVVSITPGGAILPSGVALRRLVCELIFGDGELAAPTRRAVTVAISNYRCGAACDGSPGRARPTPALAVRTLLGYLMKLQQ